MNTRQPDESAPERGGRVRRYWKRIALVAVALFVVVSVGRSVLPALGVRLPAVGSRPAHAPTTKAASPPAPAVNLDGVPILGGGQPMLTLNPGLVQPGSTVAVNGSGFDAGARVDVLLQVDKSKARQMATLTVGKDGTISGSLPIPTDLATGQNTREVTAQQRGSNKVAKAEAALAQGVAKATLSAAAAKPGDSVSLSAQGFLPGEDVGVDWCRVSGDPSAT